MKNRILSASALLLALTLANPAAAACYADYKAKRDNPLRLHYGVIELADEICQSSQQTRNEIAARVGAGNWQLLNVLSVFDRTGLDKRRASAGEYFLRY